MSDETPATESPETATSPEAEAGPETTQSSKSRIELLEPTSEDSPISKFLEKRGGGIHHIAVEVENIEATVAKLKAKGVRLIDENPRIGAEGCLVAFIHPSAANGVLLELVQTNT